ncbi:unnamed protein product, partial [marine sediment metagenome]
VSIRQLMIWQDFNYSSIQCQVETPDIIKIVMKSGTYTQFYYIQLIFAVKYRETLTHPKFQDEVYKYISGIINSMGHKALAVNGMPYHIHS